MRVNLRAVSSSLLTATVAASLLAVLPQRVSPRNQPAQGQNSTPMQFDVASIREWKSGEGPKGAFVAGVEIAPGKVYSECANLDSMLLFAYRLTRSPRVTGAPDWAHASCGAAGFNGTFAIQANTPDGTTDGTARQMMQTLLAERFKLAVNWEKKDMPVYALVVGAGGFKLKPSDPKGDPPRAPGSLGCPPEDRARRIMAMGSASLADFAGAMGGIVGRPVIDKTGLVGTYYLDLKWAGDTSLDSPLPSLPAALREEFGLDLKSETGPVDALVVDHVEKPTPN
jgi:uncharacterized protein (TIGR03435 family)